VLPAAPPLTELEYEIYSDCIPFDCKAGACSSCVIETLDGLANLSEKEAKEAPLAGIVAHRDWQATRDWIERLFDA